MGTEILHGRSRHFINLSYVFCRYFSIKYCNFVHYEAGVKAVRSHSSAANHYVSWNSLITPGSQRGVCACLYTVTVYCNSVTSSSFIPWAHDNGCVVPLIPVILMWIVKVPISCTNSISRKRKHFRDLVYNRKKCQATLCFISNVF